MVIVSTTSSHAFTANISTVITRSELYVAAEAGPNRRIVFHRNNALTGALEHAQAQSVVAVFPRIQRIHAFQLGFQFTGTDFTEVAFQTDE